MEDLIKNDATFEVYHNSEGGQLLNNRVLLSYPSERSSFQVDLGFDGYSNFLPTIPLLTDEQLKALQQKEAEANKPKLDPEKVAGAITSGATALGSVVATAQAFKGDGTKAPSRRKALKDVCGKKPLLKKNRGTYDKCVADYNAGKVGGSTSSKAPETTPTATTTEETPPPNNTKKIVIGVVVVAVIVTAFIGYKKGWFGKKAG
jgi:hypothetical protein